MSRVQHLIAFILATALALIPGCGGGGAPATSGAPPAAGGAAGPRAGSLDVAGARQVLADRPEALLLDVRGPGEWNDDVGHIEGARLIPIADLPQRLEEIAIWKDKPVIVVCRVGARSDQAAGFLVQRGFAEVYNLEGGMVAWRRAGF